MEYHILKKSTDILCVGYTIHIRMPEERAEIFKIWEKFNAHRAEIPHALGTAFGISEFGGDKVKYSAVMEVSRLEATLPKGMTSEKVPARDYAEFIHQGAVSDVGMTCEKIYQTLPQTNLKPAGPLVEVYNKDIKGHGNETVPVLLGLK